MPSTYIMMGKILNDLNINDNDKKIEYIGVLNLIIGIILIFFGFLKTGFLEYILPYSTISAYIMAASFIVGFEQLAKIFSIKVYLFTIYYKLNLFLTNLCVLLLIKFECFFFYIFYLKNDYLLNF